MQTIIKELSINPSIQELMCNTDITQILNESWWQILSNGLFGAIVGGLISGGITYYAMKIIDTLNHKRWEDDKKLNNQRWEKTTYKNFECQFWLGFYKEFHIVNRFIKSFLYDLIYSNQNYFIPKLGVVSEDNGEKYFKNWLDHFNKLYDIVFGYEDIYLTKKNFSKTHIWIIWSIRAILEDYINDDRLRFDKNLMLNTDFYKELYQKFQQYYWNNVKMKNIEVNQELENLWSESKKEFDFGKVFSYYEQQLNEMENKLQKIINGDLLE